MTKRDVLDILDNSNDGYYCHFVDLGHAYSYLIDTRLNIFRGDNDRWAIVTERLGYNPRAGGIILDISYYGNCLINLETYNSRLTNYYSIFPIDQNNYNDTIDGESLKADAGFWLVRGQKVLLSHIKQNYIDAEIELKEYEPDEIGIEEAARLAILKNREIFRASEKELYKSIPTDLKKILVLDEWFHKDFYLEPNHLPITDDHLKQTFELNKKLTGLGGMDFEQFAKTISDQKFLIDERNKKALEKERPSSYETWQLIAEVIATNAPEKYKPTLKPNTHWSNWPTSGSL